MDWSNCDGKWWEEFTPCDADHVGICENLLGNLICSKNLDQLYTGGHFLFLKGRPKISTLLLISWPWSSGSFLLGARPPIPSSFIYLHKSFSCTSCFAFHVRKGCLKKFILRTSIWILYAHVITSPYIWEWEWDAPNCSGMIKRYRVFDCHIYNI